MIEMQFLRQAACRLRCLVLLFASGCAFLPDMPTESAAEVTREKINCAVESNYYLCADKTLAAADKYYAEDGKATENYFQIKKYGLLPARDGCIDLYGTIDSVIARRNKNDRYDEERWPPVVPYEAYVEECLKTLYRSVLDADRDAESRFVVPDVDRYVEYFKSLSSPPVRHGYAYEYARLYGFWGDRFYEYDDLEIELYFLSNGISFAKRISEWAEPYWRGKYDSDASEQFSSADCGGVSEDLKYIDYGPPPRWVIKDVSVEEFANQLIEECARRRGGEK